MKTNMQYIFTGFQDSNAIRHFAFDCIAHDNSRTRVTVDADMALARAHNILLQDLPLLCLRLLESAEDRPASTHVIFTKEDMLEARTAARIASERKPAKRSRPSGNVGQAWRNLTL
jgi:hypothetical protein